jgi:hypothetical protein
VPGWRLSLESAPVHVGEVKNPNYSQREGRNYSSEMPSTVRRQHVSPAEVLIAVSQSLTVESKVTIAYAREVCEKARALTVIGRSFYFAWMPPNRT